MTENNDTEVNKKTKSNYDLRVFAMYFCGITLMLTVLRVCFLNEPAIISRLEQRCEKRLDRIASLNAEDKAIFIQKCHYMYLNEDDKIKADKEEAKNKPDKLNNKELFYIGDGTDVKVLVKQASNIKDKDVQQNIILDGKIFYDDLTAKGLPINISSADWLVPIRIKIMGRQNNNEYSSELCNMEGAGIWVNGNLNVTIDKFNCDQSRYYHFFMRNIENISVCDSESSYADCNFIKGLRAE